MGGLRVEWVVDMWRAGGRYSAQLTLTLQYMGWCGCGTAFTDGRFIGERCLRGRVQATLSILMVLHMLSKGTDSMCIYVNILFGQDTLFN